MGFAPLDPRPAIDYNMAQNRIHVKRVTGELTSSVLNSVDLYLSYGGNNVIIIQSLFRKIIYKTSRQGQSVTY
jgi:hypothetical protein